MCQPVPKLSYMTLVKKITIPDLVHWPTAAAVANKNHHWVAPYTSYKKSDTTLQRSVLCQLFFCFYQEARRRLKTRLNLS